jgi:hypothetical protein
MVPIHRLAARCLLPIAEALRIVAHLEHVVARPKAQLFQRQFHGIRSGPAKARTDDFKCHARLLPMGLRPGCFFCPMIAGTGNAVL